MPVALLSSLVPSTPQAFLHSFSADTGKLILLSGGDDIFPLSHRVATELLHRSEPVVLVDGCNRFDIHAVIRSAQQWKANPDVFLSRIFISRGFTCYQMEATLTERLPAFLQKVNARFALIFGLLDTFYDEQAPMRDVQFILRRVISALSQMKERGVSLLLTSKEWNVLPKERRRLFGDLNEAMDRVYRLRRTSQDSLQLFIEQRGIPARTAEKGGPDGTHRTHVYQYS